MLWVICNAYFTQSINWAIFVSSAFFLSSITFIIFNSKRLSRSAIKENSLRKENKKLRDEIRLYKEELQKKKKDRFSSNEKAISTVLFYNYFDMKKFSTKDSLIKEINYQIDKIEEKLKINEKGKKFDFKHVGDQYVSHMLNAIYITLEKNNKDR